MNLPILAALLVSTAWLGAAVGLAQTKRSGEERIAPTEWAKIRGVNFIPSYASNTYDIWRNYDRDLFDRELRLVEAVGYNSVRLWLNYAAFEELGARMVDRVEDALRLCAKYRLRAVIVLFDSCGVRPRKDARWMTASDAYDHFLSSPRLSEEEKQFLKQLFERNAKGIGARILVPVGADSPITVLLWQTWQPTPGNDRLGPNWYPKLERYVDALLGRLKDNPEILLWDLMNEPEFASEGPIKANLFITPEMEQIRDAFLRHFRRRIQKRYSSAVVGIGWAELDHCLKYADLADVLTFHIYAGPKELKQTIDRAYAFSKAATKPILITETLANGLPDFSGQTTDEEQLAHYQEVLPVLMKSPIGWMAWGMMISRSFVPTTNIFYPDGHPRPAAVYLERTLRGAAR